MKYVIREAKYEDAEQIAEMHIQSWREAYVGIISDGYLKNRNLDERVDKWKEKLIVKQELIWNFVVQNEGGEIVGFASGGKARTEIEGYKGELYAIYILKEYQGNNLGFLLTQKLCVMLRESGISSMTVLVLEDNLSKNFYIKYGARFLKKIHVKIGEQDLIEEIYGWDDFSLFFNDYFILDRMIDDLVYEFDRKVLANGEYGYCRRDKDLWITYRENLGWVAYDEDTKLVHGKPWDISIEHQNKNYPPEGLWVSSKGVKAYSYTLRYKNS